MQLLYELNGFKSAAQEPKTNLSRNASLVTAACASWTPSPSRSGPGRAPPSPSTSTAASASSKRINARNNHANFLKTFLNFEGGDRGGAPHRAHGHHRADGQRRQGRVPQMRWNGQFDTSCYTILCYTVLNLTVECRCYVLILIFTV